jgi:hypothetical protein
MGEQIVPVRPLDHGTDAVALFAERARSVDPDFVLDEESTAAIREICRRLDGVPLALELAAARVESMALTEIAARLDDRFRLLASGRRRSVDRHQTLRAALDWSYQILDDQERVLLRRLGVFAGTFTLDAARNVCDSTGEDVEETLRRLVRKSLVQFERDPPPGRYRLLETVRAFALEQLDAAGEATETGRSHAEWVASLVDHPIDAWFVESGVDRKAVLAELDNWRDAINFAVGHDDAPLARRLGFHTMSAAVPETARWTDAVLGVRGIEDVPGSHWLWYPIAIRSATEMDYVSLARDVHRFLDRSEDPRDRSWFAPFEATQAWVEGGDPVPVIEAALMIPGLTPIAIADLHMYRSVFANYPPRSDVEAARLAVRLLEEVDGIAVPVAYGFLAAAARDDAELALAAISRAEELLERQDDAFMAASVAAFGAMAILSLATPLAARHCRERLERLQPHLNNVSVSLLSVCLSLLRRVDDPTAPILHAFLMSAPGCAAVARIVDPELPDIDPLLHAGVAYDEVLQMTRDALDRLIDADLAENQR